MTDRSLEQTGFSSLPAHGLFVLLSWLDPRSKLQLPISCFRPVLAVFDCFSACQESLLLKIPDLEGASRFNQELMLREHRSSQRGPTEMALQKTIDQCRA